MKRLTLLAIIALLFSCSTQTEEKKPSADNETTAQEVAQKAEAPASPRLNFAVIWKWKTTDKELVADNSVTIAKELTALWKRKVVENAYYEADAKVDKFEYFPNISFFLKAESKEEAKSILDKLSVVKKGIAEYTIYPVGTKWLGRKAAVINKKGITNSYVAVWNTLTKHDGASIEKMIKENAKAQAEAITKLWEAGIIENVYFDIEGTQKLNQVTDFVFFINANSEEEARKVCNNLPFTQKKLSSYLLQPVGVFWLGEFK